MRRRSRSSASVSSSMTVGVSCGEMMPPPDVEAMARELEQHPYIESMADAASLSVVSDLTEVLTADARLGELVSELSAGSVVVVPLSIRGEKLGVMKLFFRAGGYRRDRYHLTLAEEVGRRASQAIENALLYGRAREAIEVREELFHCVARAQDADDADAASDGLAWQDRRVRAPGRPPQGEDSEATPGVGATFAAGSTISVEELLDVARLRTGRMRLQVEKFDLKQLLLEVASRHRESLELSKRELVLEAPESLVGRWDRLRIDQVLTNLVSNAVKYGGSGSIRISARLSDAAAMVTVADEGIGIAEPEKARIFEPFERGAITKDYGGLGLGLYIARQIVDAHGGSISVESEPGRGSTFVLVLPLSPSPVTDRGFSERRPSAPAPAAAKASAASQPSVAPQAR